MVADAMQHGNGKLPLVRIRVSRRPLASSPARLPAVVACLPASSAAHVFHLPPLAIVAMTCVAGSNGVPQPIARVQHAVRAGVHGQGGQPEGDPARAAAPPAPRRGCVRRQRTSAASVARVQPSHVALSPPLLRVVVAGARGAGADGGDGPGALGSSSAAAAAAADVELALEELVASRLARADRSLTMLLEDHMTVALQQFVQREQLQAFHGACGTCGREQKDPPRLAGSGAHSAARAGLQQRRAAVAARALRRRADHPLARPQTRSSRGSTPPCAPYRAGSSCSRSRRSGTRWRRTCVRQQPASPRGEGHFIGGHRLRRS